MLITSVIRTLDFINLLAQLKMIILKQGTEAFVVIRLVKVKKQISTVGGENLKINKSSGLSILKMFLYL